MHSHNEAILDTTPEELGRFFKHVVKSNNGCWIWNGANTRGYGLFYYRGHSIQAHRFIYRVVLGTIPSGYYIDHLCKISSCVNISHLEPVTPWENTLRSTNWLAERARATTCPKGHKWDITNTYWHRGRQCRICKITWQRNKRQTLRNERNEKYLVPDGKC